MTDPDGSSGGKAGGGHELTRLTVSHGRKHERHEIAMPCRVSFTRKGIHGVGAAFGVSRNLSLSGALIGLHRALPTELSYLNVELAKGLHPRAAILRRVVGLEVAVEFLDPLPADELLRLLSTAPDGAIDPG